MSDQEPQKKRSETPSGKRSERKRPDRSNTPFWIILLVIVAVFAVYMIVDSEPSREELKFSELVYGLSDAEADPAFDRTNVHELVIGPSYIDFQDQPLPEDSAKPKEGTTFYRVPVVALDDETKAGLIETLKEKRIPFEMATPVPAWVQLLSFLALPLLFLAVLLIVFRRMGGAGSALSFGRSRGKLHAQDDLQYTFKDVAGIEEAVGELREVVDFLKHPQKYQSLGGRIPRGVLLVGPPGTGKTLLAKAVAGEAGVPFFSLSGSDFVEMFVGVGAARVRDMFAQAVQRSPAIIFIDELDALGKTRGTGIQGGHDEREQTLNAMLVEMDGFGSDDSVIVIGATNRPETLDPALMRPGRFDRHVLVDRPDVKGREEILKVHVKRIKMAEDVNLDHLAKITAGFVGADLANLVNEAALLAARQEKSKATMAEFEEAAERVVAGLEKQSGIIHEETKQRVAWHENGHALVACCLPNVDPVHKISIIPRGMGALGYTMQRPEEDRHLVTQSELEGRIMVLLGGIAAEDIIYQETSTGASNDLQRATDLARRMVTEFGMSPKLGRVYFSETQTSPFLAGGGGSVERIYSEETLREIDLEVRRIIDGCAKQVYEILEAKRDVLEHMTRDLLEMETMSAEHLQGILDQYSNGPQLKPGTFVNKPEPEDSPLDSDNNDVPPALGTS